MGGLLDDGRFALLVFEVGLDLVLRVCDGDIIVAWTRSVVDLDVEGVVVFKVNVWGCFCDG